VRTIRYQQIADELRGRVRDAQPGQVLSSESDLVVEFEASRVTVRRALETLRDEGYIESRKGYGWIVTGSRVPQHLQALVTIEHELEGRGVLPERRVIEFAFEAAPLAVSSRLGTSDVLRVRRLNLADRQPFAVVTVWCPAELGQHLSRRAVEARPFYELIDVPLRGATQVIGAAPAEEGDAVLLGIAPGSPVLRCERVTTDTNGRPVLMSEHVYPAHRTEFVVDLPHAEPSVNPSGLRLVEG
jgi:GntR family transcriptional regulator